MRLHILETLLHEAVKVSRVEDIRETTLVDAVQKSLEYTEETDTLTLAENDALKFLRRLREPQFQIDLERAIQIIDHAIKTT